YYHVAVWHGFNLPLVMSLVALAGGALLFVRRHRLYAFDARVRPPVTFEQIYSFALDGVERAAERVTALLENGSLQRYVLLFVMTALAAGAAPLLRAGAM